MKGTLWHALSRRCIRGLRPEKSSCIARIIARHYLDIAASVPPESIHASNPRREPGMSFARDIFVLRSRFLLWVGVQPHLLYASIASNVRSQRLSRTWMVLVFVLYHSVLACSVSESRSRRIGFVSMSAANFRGVSFE